MLRIVYTDGGDIWLLEDDRPPRQLSSSGSAQQVLISSDGRKVVFVRRTEPQGVPPEIRSINIDGSDEKVIMSPSQFDALYSLDDFLHNDLSDIAFIPGTHTLMLNTRAIPEGPGVLKYDDLMLLDADTGALTTLFLPGEAGDFTLSPDGKQVALV
ncbi:MAG: hypothetical protein GTO63_33065, partial [Anaerolineae bacterium]|nr:hypothetical protein [Anaerolineae bacterium]